MLIDQAIEMFEDCIADGDAGPFAISEVKHLLALIKEAPAYDVGGVEALLRDLKKKGHFDSFIQEVKEHPGTAQSLRDMGQVIWLEGFTKMPSYSILFHFNPAERCTHLYCMNVEQRGFATFVCSDSDMVWREKKTGQPIADQHEFLVDILGATAYLASNPKSEMVIMQEARDEKRNKRGTKVLQPKRKRVRTIVIDGVERIKVGGVVTYQVHPRGWHVRRHKVAEHLRQYASGKVVTVRAHERGDTALGYVPWFKGTNYFQPSPKHYRVDPDQSFYRTEN